MYLVLQMHQSHPLDIMGKEVNLPLSWYDKMIGVCPVFEDEESAIEYSGGKSQILKVTPQKKEDV